MKRYIFILLLFSFTSYSQETYVDSLQQERAKKQEELSDTNARVLTKADLEHFKQLDYYDVDESFKVQAKVIRDKGKRFKMPTSTERQPVYRRYGYLLFEIDGEKCKLTVYQNMALRKTKGYEDYYFIPFRDETSAISTYGGGRYLDMHLHGKEAFITIDFNLAYSPYCAYSHRYSCPIPPPENTLTVEINAGEKTPIYHTEH